MATKPRRATAAFAIFLLTTAAAAGILTDKPHSEAPYALLFGTVFGADDRPIYGVKITIRRSDQKKPKWELVSNHSGEFAQRVPAGAADYIVTADVKTPKGQPKPEVTVHVDNDERKEFNLHLK